MPKRLWLLSLLILWTKGVVFAKQQTTLEMPPNGQCLDTLEGDIKSIFRDEGRILLGLSHQNFFIKTPFKGFKKDQEASFGEHKDSERLTMPKDLSDGNWQGITVVENKVLMLDGEQARVAIFSLDKLAFVHSRSIAWDRVRPARDAKGEPTKPEVQKAQEAFRKAFYKAGSEKFTGIARDTEGWLGKDAYYFFVATTIPGFPLVTLTCSKEDAASCYFDRTCFVEGLSIAPDAVAGIALDRKHRALLMADSLKHTVNTLAFKSCFHSQQTKVTPVDKKIRTITSLFLDNDRTLWLSTSKNDDYNNASAYAWPHWE